MCIRDRKIYVGDMELPGMLYAKVLLSTVPHARIKSIDTSAAEALPGVKAVATYKLSLIHIYPPCHIRKPVPLYRV